ncbi:MAG: RNA-binding S4 domain-containing protein [Proteobacteria bacterium]|nr:RNA-binding S4 domain-containing protein [Pseudomonadota bacterium]
MQEVRGSSPLISTNVKKRQSRHRDCRFLFLGPASRGVTSRRGPLTAREAEGMHDQSSPPSAPYIKLDQFLKWQGVAESGGAAKALISEGAVQVNGESETRRGRKLRDGDHVTVGDVALVVQLSAPEPAN